MKLASALLAAFVVVQLATPTTVRANETTADGSNPVPWRKDPSFRLRPASYLGGALSYVQLYTWLEANDDHKALTFGPMHSATSTFRVGDALTEHFCLGFQVQFMTARNDGQQLTAFALLLDATFYPFKGLGIRPSAGFGFGFAQGENQWEFGSGGPGTLAMALLYEFRVNRVLSLAPIVQTTWLAGPGYDALFFLAGVEVTVWFRGDSQPPPPSE